ncbi:hypothetical protein C8J56DRAFT_1117061 [Mycena floridula]|nr:hypothetical protein C8J56DRAFT_1117061 [Mycena floridula]
MNDLSDLRRLTVEANIDLSPIFEGLQHFPSLHAISLMLPDKENLREPSHLLRFLNLHRENITSAYFVGHISLPTPLLSELDFPYCHALEIDSGLLLDEWVTPVGLRRMRALTELSLLCPMTHPQLMAFLYCCASLTSAGTLNLQRLNLCPVDFSAALLDVLLRLLPQLRYLSCKIINVVDEKLVYVTPMSYFPLKSEMGTPSSHDKSRIDYEFRLLSVLDPF